MQDKQKIISMVLAILILILGIVTILTKPNIKKITIKEETKDAEKMAKSYKQLPKDNLFVYRSQEEIIKILENGTGIVYLGFPECNWCQEYIPYLNEVGKKEKLTKIYYLDIFKERKENSKNYQKIVSLLSDYLQYDEEGQKRIYVPCIIAVDQGKIVGFDDETAWNTEGIEEPNKYWTKEKKEILEKKLTEMIKKTQANTCTNCNK